MILAGCVQRGIFFFLRIQVKEVTGSNSYCHSLIYFQKRYSRKLNLLTPCTAGVESFILEFKEEVPAVTCSILKLLCFLMFVSGRKKEIIDKCRLIIVIYHLASFESLYFSQND